jgi:hypothetical protein
MPYTLEQLKSMFYDCLVVEQQNNQKKEAINKMIAERKEPEVE